MLLEYGSIEATMLELTETVGSANRRSHMPDAPPEGVVAMLQGLD